MARYFDAPAAVPDLAVGLLLAATVCGRGTAGAAAAYRRTRSPQPVIESARGDQCVDDPAFMRRNHMELLKHQRDDTVHGGIRSAQVQPEGVHRLPRQPDQPAAWQRQATNFCQSCHSYAAVKIDCFECHSTKPAATAAPCRQAKPAQAAAGSQLHRLAMQQQVKP